MEKVNLRKFFFWPKKKYVSHYFHQRATYLSFIKKLIHVPNGPVELRWKASTFLFKIMIHLL